MKKIVDILHDLYLRLDDWGCSPQHREVVESAIAQNNWFSEGDIDFAIRAIRDEMLHPQKVAHWLEGYENLPLPSPENILIIMAGNIPLVGFFDLICTLAVGDRAFVKPSSKDSALTSYMIEQLKEIEPNIPILIYNESEDLPKINRVIATGSDATAKIFREKYSKLPILLRGTRHSVAVLSGAESTQELDLLRDDIYRYSGLGCRNVSMIFTPRLDRLKLEHYPTHPKYRNNYLQTHALMTLKGTMFYDNGSSIFVESQEFPTSLSAISVVEYSDLDEVRDWLATHDTEIQCVVGGDKVSHSRSVAFGEAQRPRLCDYPDEIDVLKFLRGVLFSP
ncbi:MAG: acyl-CoA reductase [Rikenellaceae bacterium]